MTEAPTLTGQDIGEAQGALRALLDTVLVEAGTTGNEYIVMRILAVRGPLASPTEFREYLATQRQLDLDPSGVAELLGGLEAGGIIAGSSPDGPGPVRLTDRGQARYEALAAAVMPITTELYGDLDPDDLATAHRVLVELTQRAVRMSSRSTASGRPPTL
jgi:DNA-binding MarR family transcriptional regulator